MKIVAGIFVAALFLISSIQSTPFKNCKNGSPPPKEVRVTGCNKNPCSFIRGTNLSAEWDFSIPEDTKTLKPRVRATVLGVTVDYPFPQKNACTTLKNQSCPLEKGENVTYQLTMPIQKSYPRVPLTVEFTFLDDEDKVVICFALPAKVTDK